MASSTQAVQELQTAIAVQSEIIEKLLDKVNRQEEFLKLTCKDQWKIFKRMKKKEAKDDISSSDRTYIAEAYDDLKNCFQLESDDTLFRLKEDLKDLYISYLEKGIIPKNLMDDTMKEFTRECAMLLNDYPDLLKQELEKEKKAKEDLKEFVNSVPSFANPLETMSEEAKKEAKVKEAVQKIEKIKKVNNVNEKKVKEAINKIEVDNELRDSKNNDIKGMPTKKSQPLESLPEEPKPKEDKPKKNKEKKPNK